jgi:hypothetical protein
MDDRDVNNAGTLRLNNTNITVCITVRNTHTHKIQEKKKKI